MQKTRLIREQMDAKLAALRPIREASVPARGWIRAVRTALGMQGKQLAERIGITPQSLSEIERSEAIGTVSIKTIRRVAEAMDCEFVYALVPRTSLDEMVRRQAGALAKDRLSRASHTMALEGQALDAGENQSILARMTDQIADESPQSLWDKKL